MKIHKRGQMSPAEIDEVIRLSRQEKLSTRKIAARFNCSHVTISRILKRANSGPTPTPTPPKPAQTVPKPQPPPSVIVSEIPPGRIDFRQQKLKEVAGDIMATRLRGSVHVLPALHRLHLQIHDELATMKEEADVLSAEMNSQGLIATISQTIARLPPVLRHQLRDELEGLTTAQVVPFPQQEEHG